MIKKLQTNLLNFLENDDDLEEKFQNLAKLFVDQQFHDEKYKLKLLLHLFVTVHNNHFRKPFLLDKIEQILQLFKNDIKIFFSNSEIFHIFRSSKRILLFLLEEKIMFMDEYIVKRIAAPKYIKAKYPQYFQPEIQPFISEKMFQNIANLDSFEEEEENSEENTEINLYDQLKKELPNNFYKQRKIGENDDLICQLIQKDSIEEFIIYVKKNDYSLKTRIKTSIYETNSFLFKKNSVTLIEYAVFYGSSQIFNYLRKNGVDLTSSLWLYAIHGDDAEIIQILEENKVLPPGVSYDRCIKESIKCHHNHIVNYIINNLLNNANDITKNINFSLNYNENICSYCFHYYNFAFYPTEIDDDFIFYYACEYDYFEIVEFYLKEKKMDINAKVIQITMFLYCLIINFF